MVVQLEETRLDYESIVEQYINDKVLHFYFEILWGIFF